MTNFKTPPPTLRVDVINVWSLINVKSNQSEVYAPFEFSEAATKFAPSIHSVYLPGIENTVEPENISVARKINQTLKVHKLERKCSQNGDTYINFFKIANDEDSFTCSGMEARMKSPVAIMEARMKSPVAIMKLVKVMINVRNAREVRLKVKSGCCPACHQWYHEDCIYE